MMNRRRLLAWIMSCAMAIGLMAPGMPGAAEGHTVYVAKDNAYVYDISGTAIGVIGMGTPLELTGMKGQICQIYSAGHTGYMYRADLTAGNPNAAAAAPSQSAGMTVYASVNGARVYNRSGAVLGTIPANTQLTCTAVRGNLCQVVNAGKTAYMLKSELSQSPVNVQTMEAAPSEPQTNSFQPTAAYANRDGARVYNIRGSVLGTVPVNTAVTVTAVKGNICQVVNSGRTAYMLASELSASPVEVAAPMCATAYVGRNGAPVYNASGAVLGTLSANTVVNVTAQNSGVCRVERGGKIAYMKAADLSCDPVTVDQAPASSNYTLKVGDSGEAVKRVQTRLKELGYFGGAIGGNYQAQTQAAVAAFQTQAKLSATGVADMATLEAMFSSAAPSAPKTAVVTLEGNSTVAPATGTAKQMDWWSSGIQAIFPRGATAVITDVATGLAWREQRKGGTNHADVQPLTAADTAVLKRVYGGKWSWDRRAIFVTINGVNYAASMNGMPHGSGSISGNNFNGHHCIHFTNSRTHGSNKICSLHQAAIKKALSATL